MVGVGGEAGRLGSAPATASRRVARLDPSASGSVTRRGAGVKDWGGTVAGERWRGRDEADGGERGVGGERGDGVVGAASPRLDRGSEGGRESERGWGSGGWIGLGFAGGWIRGEWGWAGRLGLLGWPSWATV